MRCAISIHNDGIDSCTDFYRGYQFSTTVTFVPIVALLRILSNLSRRARERQTNVLALLIAQLCNAHCRHIFFASPA